MVDAVRGKKVRNFVRMRAVRRAVRLMVFLPFTLFFSYMPTQEDSAYGLIWVVGMLGYGGSHVAHTVRDVKGACGDPLVISGKVTRITRHGTADTEEPPEEKALAVAAFDRSFGYEVKLELRSSWRLSKDGSMVEATERVSGTTADRVLAVPATKQVTNHIAVGKDADLFCSGTPRALAVWSQNPSRSLNRFVGKRARHDGMGPDQWIQTILRKAPA